MSDPGVIGSPNSAGLGTVYGDGDDFHHSAAPKLILSPTTGEAVR